MYPVIQTAIAAQRIREMQAEAARAAQAGAARAGAARQPRSPRLGWLFDLAARRGAARQAGQPPGLCCPDYLLTGHCAVHTGAHRVAAGSNGKA